nr:uncharacterized protein LOC101949767 isoform X6 [Chrysemys picta bellii]XP_042711415.1 uncharacterized protein LOC101949767 isoform X6 [Chrysemys picta bellii]XP_042711416.1 uncharacterized protein LOC101949767 isoform X6 [Chrysemys picta bellii]
MGKQHLQNLTGEFEKETAEFSKHQKLQEEKEEKDESEEEIDSTDLFQFGGLTSQKNFASSDFCFLQAFIFRLLKFREFELCELKRSLTKAYEEQESLKKQLEDLKNQQLKLETDFASIKAYSGTLEKEFENLNMVPMLFQFHLQIVDTRLQSAGTRPGAEPWAGCRYPRLAGGLSRTGGPDPNWQGAGWLEPQTSSEQHMHKTI